MLNIPPLLSIITINLNNTLGLEKTIQSVISQKFTNYEYIIIDGNSTDTSLEVIKMNADKIHYWISEPDTGIYNAMNKGIKKTTGKYIIFMNSGDCFVNENVLSDISLDNQNSDFLVGNYIMNWKKKKERRIVSPDISFYNYIYHFPLHHQATFTKRSLFDEIGLYDETLRICSDRKFLLLALFKYDKTIQVLNKDIAIIDTIGVSNLDVNIPCLKEERDKIFQENFPYFYKDFQEMYKLKRFTFNRLNSYVRWKLRKFIRG